MWTIFFSLIKVFPMLGKGTSEQIPMAVYLPKAREQSTSHLPESQKSKCRQRHQLLTYGNTDLHDEKSTSGPQREIHADGEKLHGDLCRKELPTVLPHKIKLLLDVSRAPLKPTICKKDNLKYKHFFKKIKARSKKNSRV